MRHFPGHQDDVSEYLLCSQNHNDVHSNQLQRRNKKTRSRLLSYILWWWAISSFQPVMKSLNNQGIPQLLGKSCFFHIWQYHYQSEAANLTGCSGQRGQFVLSWFETFVAEGYSALSERKRNTKLQEPDTWAGEVTDTDGQGGSHAQSSRDWYQLGKKEGRKACRQIGNSIFQKGINTWFQGQTIN